MSSQPEKITAIFILEAMGRPKEHLKEALQELIDAMKKEKGVKVNEFKINEPTLLKDQKDLFTTFTEIEIEVEGPEHLAGLMFKYMPAHIEVIEPENLKISNNVYSDILSEITRKLHKYDEVARVIQMEKQVLENKIKELEKK
ncbi:MAG: hypothetical protein U9Q99_00300 [Nanoarchaeota archaeon]|nr:hypothetical protein [Nanoarchaeota archaeon]